MSQFPQIALAVSASLSVVSVIILILVYAIKIKSRTFGFRLVIPLFIFDFIWSFNVLIPILYLFADPTAVISTPLCNIQGTIKLFSVLGSFFTTVCVSWSVYSFIILQKPIHAHNTFEHFAKYLIIIPLFFSIIPLIFQRYDHLKPFEGVMCFIYVNDQEDYFGLFLRAFLYQIPFCLTFIFDMYVALRIYYYSYKNQIDISDDRTVKNVILYPIILLFSWIWIIIERVIQATKNEDIDWLNNMDLTIATLNGFLNAVVYGYLSINPFQYIWKTQNNLNSEIDNSHLISTNQNDNVQKTYSQNKEDKDFLEVLSHQTQDCSLSFN